MSVLVGITDKVIHGLDPATGKALCGMRVRRPVGPDVISRCIQQGGALCLECAWAQGLECPRCGTKQYDRKLCGCHVAEREENP